MKRALGRMRHRLLLKAIGRTADGRGGYTRGDTDLATVAARIKLVSTMEANTYSQLQERATHKAMIRWRSDVDQGQTAVWKRPASQGGDLPLYILTAHDADPDNRPGEFMELIMREGGNL